MIERFFSVILVLAMCLTLVGMSEASVIGNWSGSSRSWNDADMSTIKSLMSSAGHTVKANGAMDASYLAGTNVFVVGEATSSPTSSELSTLSSWVTGGGILLTFADSGFSGGAGDNAILAGIGSSISFASAYASGSPMLSSGIFATDGPPYNIAGQYLSTTPATQVVGGIALAADYIRYEAIGSGYVFAFGDRSDHNIFGNPNQQLFLNIAAGASSPVPVPAAVWLLGSGLVGLFGLRRKFSK